MRKKPKVKSREEIELEEAADRAFYEKNRRELHAYFDRCIKEYPTELAFERPYTIEDGDEILAFMRKKETEKLLKAFPNFYSLSEWEQTSAKCILKFGLDPKKFSLKREHWSKINEAIAEVLKKDKSSEMNPDLCRFKK